VGAALALYLASFILAFDHPRWYVRPLFIVALVALLPAMAFYVPSLNLHVAVPLYLAGLFVACMFCHGELARLKPDPLHLTRYYLMISLGGALGAVLVAILAPLALPGYFELGSRCPSCRSPRFEIEANFHVGWRGSQRRHRAPRGERRARLQRRRAGHGARLLRRGAHGGPRQPIPYRSMYHRADHARRPAARRFVPQHAGGLLRSDLGLWAVFQSLREMRRKQPLSVGIIGLGAGVVAAWMQPGDALVFYEISPRVATLRGASSPSLPTRQRAPSWSWATGACRSSASRRAATTCWAWTPFRRFDPDATW